MEQINNIEELPVEEMPHIEHEHHTTPEQIIIPSTSRSFIEANTVPCTLNEIKDKHIIPVWAKQNEPLISHSDFIQHTVRIVSEIFQGEQINAPSIRLSHPIKGRIPEAKSKPADQLLESEKTLWYERMMFVIEIPSIREEVGGNQLSLTIGGVKSFSEDNLFQNANGLEHFKFFIGFQNRVCLNLCIFSDGYAGDIAVKGLSGLIIAIHSLIRNYNSSYHIHHLNRLTEYQLSEKLFAQLIGRIKMYQFLPNKFKRTLQPMLMGDSQISTIVKDYYRCEHFYRDQDGSINLWRLFNLFTEANKASYIDQFLSRSTSAYSFVESLRWHLEGKNRSWFLD